MDIFSLIKFKHQVGVFRGSKTRSESGPNEINKSGVIQVYSPGTKRPADEAFKQRTQGPMPKEIFDAGVHETLT